MKIGILMKRYYTNRDLIGDRYGRMFHLPIELARRGWDVRVFCPDFRTREYLKEEIDGVVFCSIPSRFSGNWISSRDWKEFDADVWMASGQLFAGRQVSALAHRAAKPWVFDLYDYYPAFFPKLVRHLTDRWAKRVVARASGVVAASYALENWAIENCPNVIRIPNGIDREVFYPRDRIEMRHRYGLLQEEKIVGLFGSISEKHGMLDTLKAMNFVKESGVSARLVCAGYCSSPNLIEQAGGIWMGAISQSRLAELICACDCVLAPYPESDQIRYSNSCRIMEFLACQVPVVATRVGDQAQWLPRDYVGLAGPGDVMSLAGAIESQLKSPEILDAPSVIDWNSLGGKLDEFLQGISRS